MRKYSIEKFTCEYWVLVHSIRRDHKNTDSYLLDGAPVRPIDMQVGMLVFSSFENAEIAAEEQYRLYGIRCRPQLLAKKESPENQCNPD